MPKTVQDIINNRKEVYSLSNQTTVAEAARYLKDRGIRAAGVRNVSGKIVAWFPKAIYPTKSLRRTTGRQRCWFSQSPAGIR